MHGLYSERQLISIALALGAKGVAGWSRVEAALVAKNTSAVPRAIVRAIRSQIRQGHDPLGAAFCDFRSPKERRPTGATYTPFAIVRAMVQWASTVEAHPHRIVDPGVGSARFLIAAGRRFPTASLIGIEIDPVAAILARGHLAAAGMAQRASVLLGDYRTVSLPRVKHDRMRTLFIGNPPYVRHHLISPEWKAWLTDTAKEYHFKASQLAGLHVYFFLATLKHAAPHDFGAFITAAEWLDVNYGHLVRGLFLGPLGGNGLTLIEPTAEPFPDAATTASIACFEIGTRPRTIRLRRVNALDKLFRLADGGRVLRRERLQMANRWTPLTRNQQTIPEGFVELGELCRVHRGQVTGANEIWIAGAHSRDLPKSVLFAAVTKARELFGAESCVLLDASSLRRVIDLPVDLDQLEPDVRQPVEAFLKLAKKMGADNGYIARNRKAWWSVGLREPAPILASYMARRPPVFVRNLASARHINIAHGIYPREALSTTALDTLATFLNRNVGTAAGRTYSGGLTKFEPKEMERLLVPDLPMLNHPAMLSVDAHPE